MFLLMNTNLKRLCKAVELVDYIEKCGQLLYLFIGVNLSVVFDCIVIVSSVFQ